MRGGHDKLTRQASIAALRQAEDEDDEEEDPFDLEGGGSSSGGAGSRNNARVAPLPPLESDGQTAGSGGGSQAEGRLGLDLGFDLGDVENPGGGAALGLSSPSLSTPSRAQSQGGMFAKALQDHDNNLAINFGDGSLYAGEWAALPGGRVGMAGLGVFEWSGGGDVYSGQFKEGVIEGLGVFKWSNGDVYCGECRAGLQHGFGCHSFAGSAAFFEGSFQGGLMHGYGMYFLSTRPEGVFTWAQDKIIFGNWAMGELEERIAVPDVILQKMADRSQAVPRQAEERAVRREMMVEMARMQMARAATASPPGSPNPARPVPDEFNILEIRDIEAQAERHSSDAIARGKEALLAKTFDAVSADPQQ
jgi:hypothetical protein